MKSILFLCTGNSCRSQMAEGWAKTLAPADLEVYSAGVSPSTVNPNAIAVMREVGVDITTQWSKGVHEVPKEGLTTIITLCDHAHQTCPYIPGDIERIHWSLEDPYEYADAGEKRLDKYREIRDEIKRRIEAYMKATVK